MSVETLSHQDEIKLGRFSASTTTFLQRTQDKEPIVIEGEPLYSDRPWDNFHTLAYGTIIPQLVALLGQTHKMELAVLYDEYTTGENQLGVDYFMSRIDPASIGTGLATTITTESSLADAAHAQIKELEKKGLTKRSGKQVTLNLPLELSSPAHNGGQNQLEIEPTIDLTYPDGRPTCPVLDAVYQRSKIENGVVRKGTTILVHRKDFFLQQRKMLTLLWLLDNESFPLFPFNAFMNIFTRERKGQLGLAEMRRISRLVWVQKIE